MDERFTNSLITSSINYLINLQYLAKNPPRLIRDLNLFKMIHQVYMWADWFNIDQPTQLELQKKMEYLTLNNTDLALLTPFTNTYYSNVSSPQTISTWTRVWDDPNVITHDNVILGTSIIVPAWDSNTVFLSPDTV